MVRHTEFTKSRSMGVLGMGTDHMDPEMEAGGFCPRESKGGEYFDTVKLLLTTNWAVTRPELGLASLARIAIILQPNQIFDSQIVTFSNILM